MIISSALNSWTERFATCHSADLPFLEVPKSCALFFRPTVSLVKAAAFNG